MLPADAIMVCDKTKSRLKGSFEELCPTQGGGPDEEAESQRMAKTLLETAVVQLIRCLPFVPPGDFWVRRQVLAPLCSELSSEVDKSLALLVPSPHLPVK